VFAGERKSYSIRLQNYVVTQNRRGAVQAIALASAMKRATNAGFCIGMKWVRWGRGTSRPFEKALAAPAQVGELAKSIVVASAARDRARITVTGIVTDFARSQISRLLEPS